MTAALPIVQTGTPVLRARAREVTREELASPDLQVLIDAMVETMRHAPGVGLAAPQVGVGLRVIVLEDQPDPNGDFTEEELAARLRTSFALRVFVNPVLTVIGEEKATFFEGCLSVDGFAAKVERWLEVEVTGLDRHGVEQTWRVKGWPARILQHEVDHIDGTLYIDRMNTRTFTSTG